MNQLTAQHAEKLTRPDGTQQTPSYNFDSDQSLGMFKVGDNCLGFAAQGNTSFCIGSKECTFYGVPIFKDSLGSSPVLQEEGRLYKKKNSAGLFWNTIQGDERDLTKPIYPFHNLDGSYSAPSYSFEQEPTTGIYRDQIGGGMGFAYNNKPVAYIREYLNVIQGVHFIDRKNDGLSTEASSGLLIKKPGHKGLWWVTTDGETDLCNVNTLSEHDAQQIANQVLSKLTDRIASNDEHLNTTIQTANQKLNDSVHTTNQKLNDSVRIATEQFDTLIDTTHNKLKATVETTQTQINDTRRQLSETEQRITTVANDAEQRITTVANDAEQRITTVANDAEQRITTVANDAEQKVINITNTVDRRLSDSVTSSENKVQNTVIQNISKLDNYIQAKISHVNDTLNNITQREIDELNTYIETTKANHKQQLLYSFEEQKNTQIQTLELINNQLLEHSGKLAAQLEEVTIEHCGRIDASSTQATNAINLAAETASNNLLAQSSNIIEKSIDTVIAKSVNSIFNQCVEQVNQQVVQQVKEQHDEFTDKLNRCIDNLATGVERITQCEHQLAAHTTRITVLEEKNSTYLEQHAHVDQLTAQHTEQIAHVDQLTAQHTEQIAHVDQLTAQHTEQIAHANQQITQCMKYIAKQRIILPAEPVIVGDVVGINSRGKVDKITCVKWSDDIKHSNGELCYCLADDEFIYCIVKDQVLYFCSGDRSIILESGILQHCSCTITRINDETKRYVIIYKHESNLTIKKISVKSSSIDVEHTLSYPISGTVETFNSTYDSLLDQLIIVAYRTDLNNFEVLIVQTNKLTDSPTALGYCTAPLTSDAILGPDKHIKTLLIPGNQVLITYGNVKTFIMLSAAYNTPFIAGDMFVNTDCVDCVDCVYDPINAVILSVDRTISDACILHVFDIHGEKLELIKTKKLTGYTPISIEYNEMTDNFIIMCHAEDTDQIIIQLVKNTDDQLTPGLSFTKSVNYIKNVSLYKSIQYHAGKLYMVLVNNMGFQSCVLDDNHGVQAENFIGLVQANIVEPGTPAKPDTHNISSTKPDTCMAEVCIKGRVFYTDKLLNMKPGKKVYYRFDTRSFTNESSGALFIGTSLAAGQLLVGI